jgi:hypothetical protein
MPATGRTLSAAVLRPLAEQVAGVAAIGAGERVLELSAGDGELTVRLLSTPDAQPLTVVVADVHAAGSVRDAVGPSPIHLVIAPAWQLPFADNTFDLALSLLAIHPGTMLAATLTELARVARRAHVAVWTDGATYENALRDAWRDVRGEAAHTTAVPIPPLLGWTQRALADVARFDGIAQLWLALITERGSEVPANHERDLRTRLEQHVSQHTAADGTMRIPVRATLLTHQ